MLKKLVPNRKNAVSGTHFLSACHPFKLLMFHTACRILGSGKLAVSGADHPGFGFGGG